jgi:hypothetical protein
MDAVALRTVDRSRPRVDQSGLGLSDCERIRHGVVKQPVNAATSLAYLAAAAGLTVPARRSNGVHRAALGWYAASLAAAGVGSVAYHGPQPWWAGKVHDASIAASLAGAVLVAGTAQPATLPPLRRQLRIVLPLAGLSGLAYGAGRSESRWCDPDSRLQLHGLWHLLSAASALGLAWKPRATRMPHGPANSRTS